MKGRRTLMGVLKGIGIILFLAILRTIDRPALAAYLRMADPAMLLAGFCALMGVFVVKALRWKLLVEAAGVPRSMWTAWRECMIGTFLSTFTPAKLGDFGKVAYLRRDGVSAKTGALLVILERCPDIAMLLGMGVWAAGILWGGIAAIIAACAVLVGTLVLLLIGRFWQRFRSALAYGARHDALPGVIVVTAIGWVLHYVWALSVARGLHLEVATPVLIAALTGASMLNALPISPSGLGTRDAALVALLAPYGVSAERAVALSLVLFASTLLAAVPGGFFWLRKSRHRHPHAAAEG